MLQQGVRHREELVGDRRTPRKTGSRRLSLRMHGRPAGELGAASAEGPLGPGCPGAGLLGCSPFWKREEMAVWALCGLPAALMGLASPLPAMGSAGCGDVILKVETFPPV